MFKENKVSDSEIIYFEVRKEKMKDYMFQLRLFSVMNLDFMFLNIRRVF